MNISEIKELWKTGYRDPKAGVDWWNGKAPHFAEKGLPTAETSLAMRIIEREKMLSPECTVLDVGCGGGRFSFALEQMGARATATDFSPEMIRLAKESGAEKGSGVRFSVDDWHTLDLGEKGWAKSFDLVLANMTPAIASADTFLKLIEASRGWVLMVKPTRRRNKVLDKLNALISADPKAGTPDDEIAYAFDLAWLSGGRPRLEYETQVWDIEQPLEDAIREYTARIASATELKTGDKEKIKEYLSEIAEDGIVREKSTMDIAAMYWQVG